MVPLLQLISRGSPMSFEDSNRIIPLFYLFSSLFSHSLISVHDSEFFGHEMEGTGLIYLLSLILQIYYLLHIAANISRISVCWKTEYVLPLNRSCAVLHDALHAVRTGDFVSVSERCMSGNHQAGLSRDQSRAQRGVHGCLPQRWCQDKHWGPAAHPGRAETLGAALQGKMNNAALHYS